MKPKNNRPFNVIIFDMDGVLVDVSKSYRKTIQHTVQIYLEACFNLKRGQDPLVTDEEISLFKSVGGFNNDWDLTSGLLLSLLSISGIPPLPERRKFSSIEGVLRHLKAESLKRSWHVTPQQIRKRLPSLTEKVKSAGGGLKAIRRVLSVTGKTSWDGWLYRTGDLNKENVVKRIFQEIYLGKQFIRYYRHPRLFYTGQGLYLRERLLIPRRILASLRRECKLGIASGRPRFEAELALKRFRLLPYFDSVVTLDECQEEEARVFRSTGRRVKLGKPHPYALLRAIQEIGISCPRCAYVGDVVDDMRAARAARRKVPVTGLAFLAHQKGSRSLKDALLKAGAESIMELPADVLRLLM